MLTGLTIDRLDDAWRAADVLLNQGVQQVCISFGKAGIAFVSEHGERHHCLASPSKIANVTGAGDALMAGLVYGWVKSYPPGITAALACSAAAMTLEAVSTIHPTLSATTLQQRCAQDYPGIDAQPLFATT